MDKIEIREAKPEDFNDIYVLLKQLWEDKELHRDKLESIFKQLVKSTAGKYFCACYMNKVVGYCSVSLKRSLWQEGKIGYINELVVDTSYRGKGIGTTLLNKATGFAKEHKCKRIELDSAFTREQAHKVYLENGFEKRAYLFSKEL